MKPRKLFTKLFPAYFFISFIGLFVLIVITRYTFSNFYFEETKTALLEKTRLMEAEILNLVLTENKIKLAERVEALGKISDNRLTVILPGGLVAADSAFNPSEMDNHSTRDEIKSALSGGIGEASRFSPTLGEDFVYVAIPLEDNGIIVGVLRSAVTKSKLKSSLESLTNKTLTWSFGLLLLLTYFIYIQAKKISTPLENIKQQVESFAAGDFSLGLETNATSSVEINSLSSSVKAMSVKIQEQFEKINKQKNEQLAVFASMLEGVITISADMTINHVNESALRFFSMESVSTIKGVELLKVVNSKHLVAMVEKLLEDKFSFTSEVITDQGLILEVHGTLLKSENSSKLGAVLVFNDVTKLKELELHRTEFVANVSHELKTPLTSIQGYLETLQGDVLQDPVIVEKFLKIVSKHSHRLKTIIEDLLSLSSIERDSDNVGIEMQKVNIDNICRTVISLCQRKASLKNVEIELECSNVETKMNAPLIEQALINLIDNAVSYSKQDSKVIVSSSQREGNLVVSVEDFGVGISKEHHDRLFERFYSVDKARSRELGGSGLGLSIVKHIALTHNGNVYLKSELDVGSVFTIILPILLD